ncbi:sensor domain-containing diguanylate cyclase [Affinirhizobium pseudoryzae]|uniref:sensor domain-containing diguanylate cyclase n=1 Tax=Allorhizobium pseudoryzae TaxID=379684 RepID=UPI0013EB4B9E|nr:diguanylate cyclase [Allorhizobium pseudoryzae]
MNEPKNPFTTLLVMLAGILAVAALALWAESSNKSAHLQGLDNGLRHAALSIGNDVVDSIEMADIVLLGLTGEIKAYGGVDQVGTRLDHIIAELSKHAPDLRNIHVIGKDGHLIATTVTNADMHRTFADRAYFQYHATTASDEPLLGSPIVSRLSGEHIVTITKRLNDPSGAFAGVVVAHLAIDRFNTLLERYMSAFGSASAVVVHTDGTLLAATSEFANRIGEKVSLPPVQADLQDQLSTPVTTRAWSLDDRSRRTASFASSHPPVSITLGILQDSIAQEWAYDSRDRWFIGIALMVAAVAPSLRWYRQAKLHHASMTTLRQREQELQLLADASGDLIERLSVDGVREYVSAAAVDVLGCRPVDLVGTRVFDHLAREDRLTTTEKFVDFKRDGSEINRVVSRYLRPDGSEAWLETTLTRLEAHGILRGFVAITRDVTRRKLRHDELDALANTDTLTGLANRRAFDTALTTRLQAARDNATPLSLLIIDVDRFKLYNDTYGHASGDDCLKAVATATRSAVRRDDFVARYGGEEFAVLLERADADAARATAEKIRRTIASLRYPHERNLPWGYATISIGTATTGTDEITPDTAHMLFNAADAALYRAKGSGRNRVQSDDGTNDDTDAGKVVNV